MFHKYQLKNGLSVLLIESHKSPVTSVQMWVRTGSADEPDRLRGISHFIEHLVFKGTRSFGVGEIAATVEASGGELNAYTSFDQTVFYVTISSHLVDVGLKTISEMMGHPRFDPAEIDNEREVVIEEIKRGNDSPHRQASRLLFESMYKKHPYGEPVIGYEEIIRKVTPKQIRKYYQDRYSPANMTLLVVGDFKPNEMKKQIEEYFSDFKRTKVIKATRAKEPARKGPRVFAKVGTFKEGFLFYAWPLPKADHIDHVALDVLALVWGQGDSSRLVQKLRLENNAVRSIGASSFAAKDPGFFAVSISLGPEQMEMATELLKAEWQKILSEPPSAEELLKALTNLRSEQYYALESVDGMARKYGHFEDLFHDYRAFEKYLRALDRVTPDLLLKVARKYLRPEQLTLVSLNSRPDAEQKKILKGAGIELPRVRKTKAARHKEKVRQWFPRPAAQQLRRAGVAEKVRLESGAVVLLRPNYETPVFAMRAAFLGGSRLEPAEQQGLTELASRCWVSATKRRSESELMSAIDHTAGGISSFGGRNTQGLTLSGLRPFAGELEELFSEIMLEPALPEEIVEREKHQMLEQIKVRQDNPAQVAMLQGAKLLFGEHPMGRDPLGTETTLRPINSQIATKHLMAARLAGNAVFSFSGHFDTDRALKFVHQLVRELPAGGRRKETIPFSPGGEAKRGFLEAKKEQTHVVLLYPGLKISDPRRYALHVIEAVLAGQGGRLFLRLRDRASLAYSVAPLRQEGIDAGYFGTYIGCSPEKTQKALEMMRAELRLMADELVSESEFSRAIKYLIGRHDIELQRNSAVAAAMLFEEIYDLDFNEPFHYHEKLAQVSRQSVRALAEELLAQPEVVSVVGPRSPWS